jgi:hypothetical protein
MDDNKIIVAHPVVCKKGMQVDQEWALSLLQRTDTGWYLKSGQVEGYPFASPDLTLQSDTTNAADSSTDKGDTQSTEEQGSIK